MEEFMTTKNLIGRIALALAACSPALIANGAQTGSLVGVVKDQKGSPVAGAQVRVSAPTLMGTRVFVASSTGEFRGLMLPPGSDYTLTVTAPGFQTVTLPSRVQVNQPTAISVTMVPASGAVVEVVANSTILDTKAVGAQANYTAEANDRFPVNRTYQDLMGLAAGVQAYQNPMALGGRSTENAYLVDGVDTTDPSMGTFSLNLNEEAIQEVQVLTTGVSAEYGRFSGAVSNVVTKSGSNEFQGSIRYEFSNVGWNANKPYAPTPGMNYVDTLLLSLEGQSSRTSSGSSRRRRSPRTPACRRPWAASVNPASPTTGSSRPIPPGTPSSSPGRSTRIICSPFRRRVTRPRSTPSSTATTPTTRRPPGRSRVATSCP
ncbi:MAG: carboxypeptidase regulatory-like domain-containing protein [Chitinophagaceae bacterium]|nr:carboxypeptidase regulatory-like domain-containing protein [Chitinophagaceae bacterium]